MSVFEYTELFLSTQSYFDHHELFFFEYRYEVNFDWTRDISMSNFREHVKWIFLTAQIVFLRTRSSGVPPLPHKFYDLSDELMTLL